MQTVEGVVRQFREAAIAKGDFAEPASRDRELHAEMVAAVRLLRARGAQGDAAFRELLADPSPHVRSWVAAELLSRGEDSARPVLERLAMHGGLLAFGAQQVLAEYDAGRLRSPFMT